MKPGDVCILETRNVLLGSDFQFELWKLPGPYSLLDGNAPAVRIHMGQVGLVLAVIEDDVMALFGDRFGWAWRDYFRVL